MKVENISQMPPDVACDFARFLFGKQQYQDAAYFFHYAAKNGDITAQGYLYSMYMDGLGVKKSIKQALFWLKKSADGGEPVSQYILGLRYFYGDDIKNNYNRAFSYLYLAAIQEHPDAMYFIARCYESGYGTKKNNEESVKWLTKAAEAQQEDAQIHLAYAYKCGKLALERDPQKAIEWYQKAYLTTGKVDIVFSIGNIYYSQKNYESAIEYFTVAAEKHHDAMAQHNLGMCYLEGIGTDKNIEQAVYWLDQAAKQGSVGSMQILNNMYEYGDGVEKDMSLALKYLRMGVKAKNPHAICALGYRYLFGILGIRKNYKKAVSCFSIIVGSNIETVEALHWLAYCYERGLGVEINYEKAFTMNMKAAKKGYAPSQDSVGYAYQCGFGVEKNEEIAFQWYTKAAKQGDDWGQNHLGCCYRDGIGTEKNDKLALKWMRASAKQDNMYAIYNLAMEYEKGILLQKDMKKAIELYKRSAELGYKCAANKLKKLTEQKERTKKV